MSPTLRNMLVAVGVVAAGAGVGIKLFTPQPATRTMLELRDGGIVDGQRLAVICPERLTTAAKNRINRLQPGLLRPKQSYGRIARLGVCFNPDGGNCLRPTDGLLRVGDLEGELIVPSLRRDVVGVVNDGGADEGGEDTDVDDAFQFRLDSCQLLTCPQVVTAVAGATFTNPYANAFCLGLNRLALQPAPCMIPNGWRADGGWCEEDCGVVDCRFGSAGSLFDDGGVRWRGFNAYPRQYATGTECVPVECGVSAGDVPSEWL